MELRTMISAVNPIKSGTTKKGKPYTLYSVIAANGTRFGTFNSEWLNKIGTEQLITYEEVQNGKYLNRNIVDQTNYTKATQPLNKPIPQTPNEGLMLLKDILQYVKEIHSMLLEPQEPDAGITETDLGKGDEIKESDLPF